MTAAHIPLDLIELVRERAVLLGAPLSRANTAMLNEVDGALDRYDWRLVKEAEQQLKTAAEQMAACPCCGKPRTVDVQPALVSGRPDTLLLTCWTPGCAQWGQTMDTRDMAQGEVA